MSNRELFHATMRRENGDRLLHYELGYNAGTLDKWYKQGLPRDILAPELFGVRPTPDLFDHLNICKFAMCQFEQYYVPPFPSEIIEKRRISTIIRDGRGNTMEHRTDGQDRCPGGLIFPSKLMPTIWSVARVSSVEQRSGQQSNTSRKFGKAFEISRIIL